MNTAGWECAWTRECGWEAFPATPPDGGVDVPVLNIERTFWERALILHAEARRPHDNPVPERHLRRCDDVAAMAKSGSATRSLERDDLRPRWRPNTCIPELDTSQPMLRIITAICFANKCACSSVPLSRRTPATSPNTCRIARKTRTAAAICVQGMKAAHIFTRPTGPRGDGHGEIVGGVEGSKFPFQKYAVGGRHKKRARRRVSTVWKTRLR